MRHKMTEEGWTKVFQLRCRSKRGEHLSQEELRLLTQAYRQDPERYSALNRQVFEETAPFGARLGETNEQDT
jgi:hypothetical protein